MLASFGQDLRTALRSLVLSPRFTVVAVLTLALGIGVNGAVFSVINGTLLNVIPWKASGPIVLLTSQKLDKSSEVPASRARFEEWRTQSQSFSALIAARARLFVLTDRATSEAAPGVEVSPETFAEMGLKLALGRGFVAADAEPGSPTQVVLSHALWTERFAAAPDLVGRTIEIDETQVRVVGILAQDLWYPSPDIQILAPLRLAELDGPRDVGVVQALGILKPEVTLERARLELDTISQRLAEDHPDTDRGWGVRVRDVRELFAGGSRRNSALLLLVVAVGAVLLVACLNVANLLLARGIQRQKELAIRCSVGATRGQIVAQLLAESTLLALLALPLSLLLTRATLEWMLSKLPSQVSWVEQVFRFDAPVWLFLSGLSLLTVLLFGLLPALRASRVDLSGVIKEGGDRGSGGPAGSRLRAALTIAQLSAALALLVAASLSIQSFNATMSDEIGFDQEHLFRTTLRLPVERYLSPEEWNRFQEQLTTRVATLATVDAVGVADSFIATQGSRVMSVTIEGAHPRTAETENEARWSALSPGYLKAVGLRILLGRSFNVEDSATSLPVALVNQTMVRTWFNGESPLGDRIVTPDGERQIVGVIADVKRYGVGGEPLPEVYVPFAQQPSRDMDLLARTSGDPLSIAASFRSEVDALDHLLPVPRMGTARKALEDALWTLRLFADLMLLLAGLAVALASVGAYGVVSYSVAQRMQEFAIRGALGADPVQIVTLVLRGALRLISVGVALGLVLALFAALALKASTVLAYNVEALDPVVFSAASLLLAAIILVASAMPAYRSSRAEPSRALRAQ